MAQIETAQEVADTLNRIANNLELIKEAFIRISIDTVKLKTAMDNVPTLFDEEPHDQEEHHV
jgi:hypothetical protein